MTLRSICLVLALLPAAPASTFGQQPDTLHFTLDLREAVREGWLDAERETVGLRGDLSPLSWGTTFPADDSDGDGIYEAALPVALAADSVVFAYKIKVDGVDNPNDGWQAGRNHLATARRGQTVRVTRAWSDEPPPPPSTITGRVEVLRDVDSDGLAPRDVYVYLPPGYEESDRRYPVLYLHDGQNVFDAAAAGQEWQMDEAAEALIRAGEIEPLIIVGVGNTANRTDEYTPTRQIWRYRLDRAEPPGAAGPLGLLTGAFTTEDGDTLRVAARADTLFARIPGSDRWQHLIPRADGTFFVPQAEITLQFDDAQPAAYVTATKPPQGGDGDRYGAFLVQTLKPAVDRNFRTRPEARWTGLGGSSMGGLITMHLGLRYPDVFGRLLVASPSVWWDNRWILSAVEALPHATGQRIWLDVGTAEGEGTVGGARALRDALRARGWTDLRYVEAPDAGHSERAWAERAPDMLRFLFPPETP